MKLIVLDFTFCNKLYPWDVVPLACLIHEYKTEKYRIRFCNYSESVYKQLTDFGLIQLIESNKKQSHFPQPHQKNILPLWLIEEGAHNYYPGESKKYFENNHLNGLDLEPLHISLGEMINNIFDHSKSKIPGYTTTQFIPESNELITCVCDFGITIPKCINKHRISRSETQLNDLDAIILATQINYSSLSKPHNRGIGLNNLLNITTHLNGRFLIASGKAGFSKDGKKDHENFILKNRFPGTMVVITINTTKLEDKEFEISDELHIFN